MIEYITENNALKWGLGVIVFGIMMHYFLKIWSRFAFMQMANKHKGDKEEIKIEEKITIKTKNGKTKQKTSFKIDTSKGNNNKLCVKEKRTITTTKKAKALTTPTEAFVQNVLEKNCLINNKKRRVAKIKPKMLQGGCHYTVYKVNITYEDTEQEKKNKKIREEIERIQKKITSHQEKKHHMEQKAAAPTKKKKKPMKLTRVAAGAAGKKKDPSIKMMDTRSMTPLSPTTLLLPKTLQSHVKKHKTPMTPITPLTPMMGSSLKMEDEIEEEQKRYMTGGNGMSLQLMTKWKAEQEANMMKLQQLKQEYQERQMEMEDDEPLANELILDPIHARADKDMEPATIIVKYLEWDDLTIFNRFKLWCRQILSIHNKLSTYFQSYQIESLFYSQVRDEIERQYNDLNQLDSTMDVANINGLKIPEVYYNYADRLKMRFVMVMQDIRCDRTRMKTGQGCGFSLKQSSYCLASLAKFHASCWNHPMLENLNPVWDLGGYWTGMKRKKDKQMVGSLYEKAAISFKDHLNFPNGLGKRLQAHHEKIMHHVNDLPRATFVHGDFKVTNVFINKKKNVWTIDWQWLGRGVGAIDIAYFMMTSMRAELMNYKTCKDLVKSVYFANFAQVVEGYRFDETWEDICMCILDFFNYVIVAKWSQMTPKDVVAYAKEHKDGLHLQRYDNMQQMINLVQAVCNHLDFQVNNGAPITTSVN